jgi:DNA replication and repair protein RecF
MRLIRLSLTNFRNFARLDVDVPTGSVILVGSNAQGKTNVLEAVYFLATLTSFHATSDRQMINFLSSHEPLAVARIVADFCLTKVQEGKSGSLASSGIKNHRLEVRIIQEANGLNGALRVRKEVLLDGVKRKIGEVVGHFNSVLFLPHLLNVIEGAPEERRRYINLALTQVSPGYLAALDEYSQTLNQRNALLKQLAERGGDVEQLNFWDAKLTASGAQIIHGRIQAIQELERLAARLHQELTRGQEVLRLSYLPSYDPLPQRQKQYALPLDTPLDRSGLSLEKIQQGYLECLKRIRSEEIARGLTSVGPHRDEMRFLSNGIDLGTYGSRGQARTAVLALKLAEVSWMREKTGQWPVLLLDEVLAELDNERRQDLLSRLLEFEQAMLTTTDLDLFPSDYVQRTRVWHIQGGRIINES